MPPLTMNASASDHRAPSGIPPPTTGTGGPRLLIELDSAEVAASKGRHPSAQIDPHREPHCEHCGFTGPEWDDTADSLRALAPNWRDAIERRQQLIGSAARLRDVVHAVTNRVDRLLAAPGSHLSSVTIDAPTALVAAASPDLLIELLDMAAERLARLIESLGPDDRDIEGCVDTSTVTIADLVRVPLHHSHRDLTLEDSGRAVRVSLDTRRPHHAACTSELEAPS
ncbi:MAG: hypothetical protein ACT4PW_13865 [Acidimicrobiia bacterium]